VSLFMPNMNFKFLERQLVRIGGASTKIKIFIGKSRSDNADKRVGTSRLLHNDRLFALVNKT